MTDTGLYVAPAGTVTVSDVRVAAVTVDFTAPKNTVLLEGINSKFVPVMVTDAPAGPLAGETDETEGGSLMRFLYIDTVDVPLLPVTSSDLLSPSKSPALIVYGS